MARRPIGWAAGFWLTVCAGLAAVVGYHLSQTFPLAPTVTAASPVAWLSDRAERPTPPRSPAADLVERISARPLFSESRRPYVPQPAPAQAARQPVGAASPVELAGTFLTETDQAALLLVPGGTPEWLRKGQLIEGWRIEAIGQDRVQLRKGKQQQVLQLRADLAVLQTTRSPRQAARDATSREPVLEPGKQDEATQE